MESLNAFLLPLVVKANGFLADYILVFLLVGTGLFFSFKTKFIQVRAFGEGMKNVFGKLSLKGEKQESGMSGFQALCTAIAAQVGTGNIVGSSGAILTGGPGAIFWMWVIAFLGMSTIYCEAVLAQKTRVVKDGEVYGGPVFYITHAFKGKGGKFLANFFAIAITWALGFFGCMVQSNSIASTINTAFGVPNWIVGVALVIICAFIFVGGTQRLASIVEKLVPLMAAAFLLGAFIVIIVRIKYVPEAFAMIFKYAFTPQAIIGGGIGAALKTAISQGAKRGLFSNEAGMGSTPHAHAQANVSCPHEQGTVAIAGVFIDTFAVLTLNALVIISTLYVTGGPLHDCGAAASLADVFTKTNLAQKAFGVVYGEAGGAIFIAVALFFFAFSTILGWNMFGKTNVAYVFGTNKAVKGYTVISLFFIFLGTVFGADLVWELTDFANYLMVLPNVIGLFGCTALVVELMKEGGK